jgi:peptidyl-tRNA hydrolase, PTH1 family
MFLVVGLGNPGDEYANTPHNLGFRVIDLLAERHAIRVSRKDSRALVGVGEISGSRVMLAKPQTYMNLSGTSVAPLMTKHELAPADLILVYDELDLPWYETRIKPRGSAAGHNGVKSVIAELGANEFTRVRLGVNPGHKVQDGAEYLLAAVKRSQQKEVEDLVGRGADAVASIIAEGVEKSMTIYNRRAQGSTTEEE